MLPIAFGNPNFRWVFVDQDARLGSFSIPSDFHEGEKQQTWMMNQSDDLFSFSPAGFFPHTAFSKCILALLPKRQFTLPSFVL